MANKQIPGLASPQLPIWAKGGEGSSGFLGKGTPPPRPKRKMATGGWIGDLGPGYGSDLRGEDLAHTNSITPVDQASLYHPITGEPKVQLPAISTTAQESKGINWGTVASGADQMMPYVSNIANSFRRPPQPPHPGQLSSITLNRVNNANERAQIDRVTRGEDIAADRNLDGNIGSAYRAANLATKLRAYGDSYSRENNTNAQIANEQNQFNAGIQEKNIRANDSYNQQVLESKIAQQRNQSANLANASDKYVAIKNASEQRKLDERRWMEASRLFSGKVTGNFNEYMANPAGFKSKIEDYQNQLDEERKQRLKSLASVSSEEPQGAMGGMIGGRAMRKNSGISKMRKVYK